MVAAKQGGGDPDANPGLRLAVQKAKEARMPKENIDRAIKKGTGELGGANFEEAIYEGYGPLGGALLVKSLTDNINRTVSEIRSIFSRSGGSLGSKGSTAYIFDHKTLDPTFFVDVSSQEDAEKVDELIELLEENDDVQEVYHNYRFAE